MRNGAPAQRPTPPPTEKTHISASQRDTKGLALTSNTVHDRDIRLWQRRESVVQFEPDDIWSKNDLGCAQHMTYSFLKNSSASPRVDSFAAACTTAVGPVETPGSITPSSELTGYVSSRTKPSASAGSDDNVTEIRSTPLLEAKWG
jgi:hypothetical protein